MHKNRIDDAINQLVSVIQAKRKPKPTAEPLVFSGTQYQLVLKEEEHELRVGEGYVAAREIRIYPPRKRTINVAGRQYFLQFPHMIFLKTLELRGSEYNRTSNRQACLMVGLTNDGQTIYRMPFLGIAGHLVCLDGQYHYDYPGNSSMEKLISTFWTTDFHAMNDHRTFFNGRLHNWQEADLAQVEKEIKALASISFDSFKTLSRHNYGF